MEALIELIENVPNSLDLEEIRNFPATWADSALPQIPIEIGIQKYKLVHQREHVRENELVWVQDVQV